MTLSEIAGQCPSAGEFIRAIQTTAGLLDQLYSWEHSTPENAARFKHVGWFGIAVAYWEEQALKNNSLGARSPCLDGGSSTPAGCAPGLTERKL